MIFIMRKINIISRCANAYRGDKLHSDKLSPLHHSFVLTVTRFPGISQEELAEKLCINKSNVTRAVATLEDQGYVKRESDENDKRILRVYPAEKMMEILPQVRSVSKEWNRYLTDDINEHEIEVFQSVLERITEKAKLYMESREEGIK